MVKELTSVGAKKATSGNRYFESEFTGLEMSVKDTKRFPAEAKGWAYFTFGQERIHSKRKRIEFGHQLRAVSRSQCSH